MSRRDPLGLLGDRRPSAGRASSPRSSSVALTTLIVFPLKEIAPVAALVVVYLVAVLDGVRSAGAPCSAAATALAGALAFNLFHIPPTGRFTIADAQNWVALAVFFVVAVVASSLARGGAPSDPGGRAAPSRGRSRRGARAPAAPRARTCGAVLPAAAQRLAQARRRPVGGDRTAPGRGRRAPGGVPAARGRACRSARCCCRRPARGRRCAGRRSASCRSSRRCSRPRRSATSCWATSSRRARCVAATSSRPRCCGPSATTSASPITAIVTAAEPLASESRRRRGPARARPRHPGGGAAAVASSSRTCSISRASRRMPPSRVPSRARSRRCSRRRSTTWRCRARRSTSRSRATCRLVRADSAQLERAFANLLENAARHSGGHPVSLRARAVGQRVVVRVVDRGPGIPSAQRARVFEPFYRSGTERSGHRGSGLGLAIARGFVEANGGTIAVESLPGQGTTFVVEFPTAPVPASVG